MTPTLRSPFGQTISLRYSVQQFLVVDLEEMQVLQSVHLHVREKPVNCCQTRHLHKSWQRHLFMFSSMACTCIRHEVFDTSSSSDYDYDPYKPQSRQASASAYDYDPYQPHLRQQYSNYY